MKIKTIALKDLVNVKALIFTALFSVSVFAPLLGLQAVTGTIVNATLYLAVLFLGVQGGLLIALFPSTVALLTGILPIVAASMIPFIIMGNVVLVLTFNKLQNNFWQGVITASFLKFIFLFVVSTVVANYVFPGLLNEGLVSMMSWPQFLTALMGGIVASFIKTAR